MRCDSMPDLYASLWQRNEGQGSPPSSLSFGDPDPSGQHGPGNISGEAGM